jgi:hypothetical protein
VIGSSHGMRNEIIVSVHSRGDPSWSPNTHRPEKTSISIRRGEGGVEWTGGPLWSPAGWGLAYTGRIFPEQAGDPHFP